jgi:2-phosphoglycerate kinase
LLIGGSAAAGKTTSGIAIARRLGIDCFRFDAVWRALQSVTSPETHPALHRFPSGGEEPIEVETWRDAMIETSSALEPALHAVIQHYGSTASSVVIEGAWLLPGFAAALDDGIATLFIHEPEPAHVLAAMMTRGRWLDPTDRQRQIAQGSWSYGNWLAGECRRLGVPLVEARPRETLVDRMLAAIR